MNPTAALLVLSTAMLSGTASAQPIPGTPYQRSYQSIQYQDLVNPTVIRTSGSGQTDVNFPFQFRFYDQYESVVSVEDDGLLIFIAGATDGGTNQAPGSSTKHSWLAPYWDALTVYTTNNARIAWQLSGNSPTRAVTIEWQRISTGGSAQQISFQVRMFEGRPGRIEIDYGPTVGSGGTGTMAMEDQQGGRPVLFHQSGCTTSCTIANLATLTNTRVVLTQDPGIELMAMSVDGPDLAFLGAETDVEVTVASLHGNPIGPFTVSTLVANQTNLIGAMEAGSSQISLGPFQQATLTITSIPPAAIGEGEFYWGVRVDSNDVISEVDENNNEATDEVPVRVIVGLADLTITEVTVNQQELTAGGNVVVSSTLKNIGGEPAPTTDFTVMLSTNPVISPQDMELHRFSISLTPGEEHTETATITLPSELNSGLYYIGTLADGDKTVEELSEGNNGKATADPVTITGGNLAITTTNLPTGYILMSYTGRLEAVGGEADYRWAKTRGSLPTGLGISDEGEIFGRATIAETQNFTVEVTSGGQTTQADLSLTIVEQNAPLTIVTRAVQAAVVGQSYRFQLTATGGGTSTSSLAWTATGLPEGIEIAHTGDLIGTPIQAQTSTVALTVTNGAETAQREISMRVRENANLLIVPKVLSTATYGELYQERLEYTGEPESVAWILQLGELPRGLSLSPEGMISGTPQEVGTFRIVVEAREAAARGAKDINSFVLIVMDVPGFEVVTTSLPDAYVGEGYDQKIGTTGGTPPMNWSMKSGRLPDGLLAAVTDSGEFRLAGQPDNLGVSNLLLNVVDSEGREASRALVLRVVEHSAETKSADPDDGCGCRTEQRKGSFLGWLLLLALPLRRLIRG